MEAKEAKAKAKAKAKAQRIVSLPVMTAPAVVAPERAALAIERHASLQALDANAGVQTLSAALKAELVAAAKGKKKKKKRGRTPSDIRIVSLRLALAKPKAAAVATRGPERHASLLLLHEKGGVQVSASRLPLHFITRIILTII